MLPIYLPNQLCPGKAIHCYATTSTATSYPVLSVAPLVPLFFSSFFFLFVARLPPSSDAAKCKSVTGEYASFTRSTTRCHGSAHALCPPGLTDLFSRYELYAIVCHLMLIIRSTIGSYPRDPISYLVFNPLCCLSSNAFSGLRKAERRFVLPSYQPAFMGVHLKKVSFTFPAPLLGGWAGLDFGGTLRSDTVQPPFSVVRPPLL
ncbi:hypothetical protein F4819DRAFT_13054 [Hypoxylon fuscum]|nr:hypothetical protein F4819DRAFT_13054 [Hypoxylon fuscum]